MRIISEPEFRDALLQTLLLADTRDITFVTGPGRSGAVAAVYASHLLGVPFIPFKSMPPSGKALVIDTAAESGRTMRKALRVYSEFNPIGLVCFHEPPRVAFWYEAQKPQRYRHERQHRRRTCACGKDAA